VTSDPRSGRLAVAPSGTRSPVSTRNDLVAQLNALVRLTQTETMVAETRRGQAATDSIERELAANADKCRERAGLLARSLRDLDAVPDVVGAAAGRFAATVKSIVEQGQNLTEALLGDLALEHELLSRTRLATMMAERLDESRTLKVLERLEVAHTATIEWLMTRLGEIAIDAPPALRPTPMQSIVGLGQRLTALPARQSAQLVNRSVEASTRLGRRTAETITTTAGRTRQLIDAAGDIWTAGRDAALKRSEQTATEHGARQTARDINRTRRNLGAVDGDELPIRNYDTLTADDAISRIGRLRDADEVRTVLAYETANKARKGVTSVLQERLQTLAANLAAVS
jgi:bacterioferritin (cytochrome b1)